jgi:hypothetical protein
MWGLKFKNNGDYMNNNVNCVWIGDELSIMELLSIKLAQKLGYTVNIWSNHKFDNLPNGVIHRDLPSDILPPTRFQGIPFQGIPNGGIGSLSHWSDYFAFTILKNGGGYWMQLDFAMLKRVDTEKSYIFTSLGHQISPVFMKIPPSSQFAKELSETLMPKVKIGFKNEDWGTAMNMMHNCALKHQIYDDCFFIRDGYYDCGGSQFGQTPYNSPISDEASFFHWSNATYGTDKKHPVKGSAYYNLCKQENLI